MPLPESSCPRQRAHRRSIIVDGFLRRDGLFELEARLTDVKDADYALASGIRPAGEPVHDMLIRVVIDAEFNILDVHAVSDSVPYPGGCDTIGGAYRQLIGLNLVRGFRRTVSEMFADIRGCSHITELLFSLPTVAIQTFATFRKETDDDGRKPFQLDRCHALETSSETVRRFYPRWHVSGDGKKGE